MSNGFSLFVLLMNLVLCISCRATPDTESRNQAVILATIEQIRTSINSPDTERITNDFMEDAGQFLTYKEIHLLREQMHMLKTAALESLVQAERQVVDRNFRGAAQTLQISAELYQRYMQIVSIAHDLYQSGMTLYLEQLQRLIRAGEQPI